MSLPRMFRVLGIGNKAPLLNREELTQYDQPAELQPHTAQQELIAQGQLTKYKEAKMALENLISELNAVSEEYTSHGICKQFQAHLALANDYNRIVRDYLGSRPIQSLKSNQYKLSDQYHASSCRLPNILGHYNEIALLDQYVLSTQNSTPRPGGSKP